ncbi:unnamed protein product [Aspergillus oryzae RIB40]|uniref:DNA, SC026 n=2 Tax=Aspergillus oryzae TaxID=5062 RepID=Q2UF08_ASPOR|nr:unnamed protein product [Aspergillus oryzae RIB40]EIT77995.1 hypothetical protein Ao3042_05782 [Aspergillus oryzae 3.042]KDE79455.1 hypothetical protein AO1008_06081 [Aspergillus oryzae 100-8]BAE59857.1 unnamed protein product [Aspergillus oryzae RIB40]|eukprot:EIT77995.1 hypothetical protein Ao3042_05782 [Aspergillus oryzae 3.042]
MKESDLLKSTPSIGNKEYDSYSWELLEDHPLRSHPTECIPGLSSYVAKYLAILKRRWTERIFPIVCLILMFLIVIQFLAALPYGLTYIVFRSGIEEQKGFVQWPTEFSREPSTCILYNPQARDAIQYAIDAGCSGVKVDLQAQESELLVDSLVSDREAPGTLGTSTDETSPIGLFDEDPARPFTLFLELHTSVQAAWPHLVSQLMPLKQKGYLSYRNGTRVVPRPVTIVLTGLEGLDFGDVVGSDHDNILDSMMFDTSLEQLVKEDYGPTLRVTQSSRGVGGSNSAQTEADTDNLKQSHESSYQLVTATANFTRSIGFPRRGGRFSPQQIERVRAQVRAAHRRGLRARYEGTSDYPPPVRRMIWRILVREGADIIEIDGRGCEIPWWRRFFVTGSMECRGRKGDTGNV